MEAKDLRIGNLLECYIETDKLGWVHFPIDWQDIRECEEENMSFNKSHRPIPLTEEWVLKFEEFEKTDKEGTPCFFNGDNIMLFNRGSYFDAYLHSEYNGNVFFATRLFHVHQLQNFYHTIEKQELTIKE
jgi:hypothetical protein